MVSRKLVQAGNRYAGIENGHHLESGIATNRIRGKDDDRNGNHSRAAGSGRADAEGGIARAVIRGAGLLLIAVRGPTQAAFLGTL